MTPLPIPPNCPEFIEMPDGWHFSVRELDIMNFTCVHVEEATPAWRKIIARFAEAAFRKEAERAILRAGGNLCKDWHDNRCKALVARAWGEEEGK